MGIKLRTNSDDTAISYKTFARRYRQRVNPNASEETIRKSYDGFSREIQTINMGKHIVARYQFQKIMKNLTTKQVDDFFDFLQEYIRVSNRKKHAQRTERGLNGADFSPFAQVWDAEKSSSGKDGWANQEQENHAAWMKSIGAQNTELASLEKYNEAKYNDDQTYRLLRIYERDVKTGWISPSASFDNYLKQYQQIQKEIVGQKTQDGIAITGQREHFMQRLLGTAVDPEKFKKDHRIIRRSGVEVDDVKETLFRPEIIDRPDERSDGKRSVRYIGRNCIVTINPDTGELIQCNPRKKGKKNA